MNRKKEINRIPHYLKIRDMEIQQLAELLGASPEQTGRWVHRRADVKFGVLKGRINEEIL
ncbi:hypothetical protein ES703_102210 [subsurface metagenome]